MRLGFTSWNFESELESGSMTLLDVVDYAAQAGFDDIELMGYHVDDTDPDCVARLRQRLEQKRIRVSVIDVRNMRFSGRWFEVMQDIASAKHCANLAHALGCGTILMFLGAGADAGQLDRDVAAFGQIARFCAPLGVRIAIENHRIYLRQALSDFDEVRDIITVCGQVPGCYAAPDNDNFFRAKHSALNVADREMTYELFASLMPYAGHVHLKTGDFDGDGNHTQADLRRLARIIAQSGYQDTVCLELAMPVTNDKKRILEMALSQLKT